MRGRLFIKRIISTLLICVILCGLIQPMQVHAASSSGYHTYSPLLNGDTMAIDEMDPMEVICYAVFMSNFCVPFVDTYYSAFSSTAETGSKGGGLSALQFATGGDISSNSIIQRMTNIVLSKEYAGTVQPVVVQLKAVQRNNAESDVTFIDKNNIPMAGSTETGAAETRQAVLADLLPIIAGVLDITVGTSDTIKADMFDYSVSPSETWGHSWVAGTTVTGWEGNLADITFTSGVLGTFYVSSDSKNVSDWTKVFDMTDGWDVQLPSQCLLYAFYKYYNDEEIRNSILYYVEEAASLPLYIDTIGNIGVFDSGKQTLTIIIPAYLNQHLTTEPMINLTNAMVLNGLSTSIDKLKVASSATGVRAITTEAQDTGDMYKAYCARNLGIGSITAANSDIKAGTSVLYNNLTDFIPSANVAPTDADLKSFIDTGFNTEAKLRWSTLVYHEPSQDRGLDIQNYGQHSASVQSRGDANNREDAFIVETGTNTGIWSVNPKTTLHFNYDEQLLTAYNSLTGNSSSGYLTALNASGDTIKGLSNTERQAELLSIFQTAAQLATSGMTQSNQNIKAYYKQLKGGLATQPLIAGLTEVGSISSQSTKLEIAYTPIGFDYSYMDILSGWWTFGDGTSLNKDSKDITMADIYKVAKASYTIAMDMYHGNPYIFTESERQYVARLVSEDLTLYDSNKCNMMYLINSGNKLVSVGGKNVSMPQAISEYIIGVPYSESDMTSTNSDKYPSALCDTPLCGNWARIAMATPVFATAASYLGLREDYAFSENASDMYYTYLDIYGLIEGNPVFDTKVYTTLQSPIVKETSESIGKKILAQGLTAEQKEQALKDNSYLMLSTGEDGREYRSRIVSGMIEEWLVDAYDKTCYGDSESEYFQTLNSTSYSFLNIPSFSDNWTTQWVVARWTNLLPIFMLFIMIIVTVFGTLNGKKFSWIFANLLLNCCMLVLLPAAAETAPYLVDKVAESAFSNVLSTMSISEAVEDETIRADIEAQYGGYAESIQTAIDTLSAMSTSGSLMIKQDITRKVVPNTTTEVYEELKGLASARWLLPSILSMTGALNEEDLNNYVLRSVGEKRIELSGMNITYDVGKTSRAIAALKYNLDIPDSYIDVACNFLDSSTPTYRTGILPDPTNKTKPESALHINGLILHTANNSDVSTKSINQINTELLTDIALYTGKEYYDTVGYLQGTETLLPYFYLVACDRLINASDANALKDITCADFYNLMQHTTTSGITTNYMTIVNSSVIDVGDLQYLFTCYIPYLVQMQEKARAEFGEDKLIGDSYPLYAEEPAYFLYTCNWADKIATAYGYGDDIDPSTYQTRYGRDMIFSRAQLVELQNAGSMLTAKNLTDVELRCIEINEEIDKQWTLLLNYITTDGVTMEILAQQMALTATIAFNNIMSKDRVVNNNYALYPTAVTLRSINLDTMMKLVLISNFGLADTNQSSMKIVLAESGVGIGIVLWLTAIIVTHAVPWVIQVMLGVVFYTSILSCIYNSMVDSKEKLKTCGGAAVTCMITALEVSAYIYFYAILIGNTNKMLSIDQLEAGTTLATGKVIAILVVTIIFLGLLCVQCVFHIKNFRDMGAQMWASYSKKTFDAVTNFAKGFASKVKGAMQPGELKSQAIKSAMGDVKLSTKIDDEVKVKNTSQDPLWTKESNSAAEATYIYSAEDESDSSGYVVKAGDKGPVITQTPKPKAETPLYTEQERKSAKSAKGEE